MDVPAHLLAGLEPTEVEVVRAWWLKLPETNQSELITLCNRNESSFFDSSDDSGAVGVPKVIGGQFVSEKDTRGWQKWRAELFDYLVCHPEISAEPLVIRTFHIGCARHLSLVRMKEAVIARLALNCPFGSETCPIQMLMGRLT
jgi:hypothetical protein